MQSGSELAKIATEFPDDLARMRDSVRRVGSVPPDEVLVLAWARYSDSLCASWLTLPENDIALTEILLSYLPVADTPTGEAICTILEETEDQTVKVVVMLPSDLLHRLGWKTGDTLSLSEDSKGGLTLRRA